ncbi:MAG: PAS domain-containing protein [Patescibacteria group bacterium]|nr:PAS domain-containing protein [Patescibacteria group bacterium]MCL5261833.1 PAS domain-containing protein [Patescibacteria group bacterium]
MTPQNNQNHPNHGRHLEISFDQLKAHWFAVFDIMDVVVLVLDNTARVLYGNVYLSKLLGIAPKDLIGRDWIEEFTPSEAGLRPLFEKSIKQNKIFIHHENAVIGKNKRRLVVDWSNAVFHDHKSGNFGVISIGRDVTRERAIETGLRDIKERYKLLINTMNSGVFYMDHTGKIVAINPAAERILGISAKEVIGLRPTTSLWSMVYEDGSYCPPEDYPAVITLRTGENVAGAVRGVKTKGRPELFWIRANAVSEQKKVDHTPCHVYAIFDDITEEKEKIAEEKRHLLELEKMNRLMVDREMNMVALKQEMEKLKKSFGEKA